MHVLKFLTLWTVVIVGASCDQHSAAEVVQDIFNTCIKEFSISCVKPKALAWMNDVANKPVIKLTEDLEIVKKDNPENFEPEERRVLKDVFDVFEDFIQNHKLVLKVPDILRLDGPLKSFLPESFRAQVLSVPLATTGRSKAIKKIIVPFLLGLKFKAAVLLPIALALIALKTWKALTLGLLSLVLTGALVIFKLSKPKITTYEVVHYPHHVDHFEHHPNPTGWAAHPGYGRELTGQDLAYNAYLTK